jgi:hypothetical protein
MRGKVWCTNIWEAASLIFFLGLGRVIQASLGNQVNLETEELASNYPIEPRQPTQGRTGWSNDEIISKRLV